MNHRQLDELPVKLLIGAGFFAVILLVKLVFYGVMTLVTWLLR